MPHSESSKPLSRGEIVSIVLGAIGLLVVFFLAAPTAAGVTDMTLARLLLVVGCIAAMILAFTIEKLNHRSWKRILVTLVMTAGMSAGLAIYTNHWIEGKKAEQEAKSEKDLPSISEAKHPEDESNKPRNDNNSTVAVPKTRESKAERLRRLREQRALEKLDIKDPE
jgi:thiol:disulfide interchange protein